MNINFKAKYPMVVDEVRSSGRAFEDVEISAFGFTHCDIGDYAGRKWNLPVEIRSAISLHHCVAPEIAARKDVFDMLVVKAADYICSTLQIGICDNFDSIGEDLEFMGLKASKVDILQKKVEEEYMKYKYSILEQ